MLKLFTKKKKKKSYIDRAIDRQFERLLFYDPLSDEYAEALSHMERLYNLKDTHRKDKISPDTKATVLGSLIGIVAILGYERANVVTSKALNFVIRGRV